MISYEQRQAIKTCETLVTFKKLEMNEIEKYVESGEAKEKQVVMAFMVLLVCLYQRL
ncbi:MAG: hypothetical protein CM15mP22_6510 [Gammaproteobacteria bacterium]|nr:MAG: hypothetical protein CM15mP22_6510 [Gammaproteobacteria bacterium]